MSQTDDLGGAGRWAFPWEPPAHILTAASGGFGSFSRPRRLPMPNDPDLREWFAKLRREDQAHAGEFSSLLHRARPRTNSVRLSAGIALAAGLAVMITVAVMSIPRLGRRTIGNPEISITEWKSSTDFLLRTPGLELLRTIPRIGEWPASTGAGGGRPNGRQPTKRAGRRV
jgi:hypothetical protein